MYIITGNKGKLAEYRLFFPQIQALQIDLPEIQELDELKIQDFKIQEALKHISGDFIIDDVSFYLDCLGGFPGPLIKWFQQAVSTPGIYDIALKYNNFEATSKCTISYVDSNQKVTHFVGKTQGKLVPPSGSSGFGFDPIFVPFGSNKTYAEMDKIEKNKVSHRGLALLKLEKFLVTQVNSKQF